MWGEELSRTYKSISYFPVGGKLLVLRLVKRVRSSSGMARLRLSAQSRPLFELVLGSKIRCDHFSADITNIKPLAPSTTCRNTPFWNFSERLRRIMYLMFGKNRIRDAGKCRESTEALAQNTVYCEYPVFQRKILHSSQSNSLACRLSLGCKRVPAMKNGPNSPKLLNIAY